jgi:hypothetical protein
VRLKLSLNNNFMSKEEERMELRQIQKGLEREERLEALKVKHGITGTPEEQKDLVVEKKTQIENEIANDAEEIG